MGLEAKRMLRPRRDLGNLILGMFVLSILLDANELIFVKW